MKRLINGAVIFLAGLISLSLIECQAAPIGPQITGYPEQDRISFVPPFERPDLETHVSPASGVEVTRWFGPEFASLPRLGVVLILVVNKGRDNPILISPETVRLTLPDGRVLQPLKPFEMIGWFEEVYDSKFGKPGKEMIFRRWSEETFEREVMNARAPKGEGAGAVAVFHFPQGVTSDTFPVEYVLDLGPGDQVIVKGQKQHLNLRP